MRPHVYVMIGTFALLASTATGAAALPNGRWEGALHLPRDELQLIVDLDRNRAGLWVGSVTIPALHIKGAAISDIVAHYGALSFSIQEALGIPHEEQANFSGTTRGEQSVAGTFTQGGNSAPFELKRTGPAQVELPPTSTPISQALAGTWEGTYELNGRKRLVTLKLESHGEDGATATLVIIGKEPRTLPVDLVTVEGSFLTIESHRARVILEGRVNQSTGEFLAVMEQRSVEAPLVLRHKGGGAS
jgi:hypothetical protein